ncbi:hypothetical protein [Alkaliphilus transvaalensis]|uniref:hypothetical protein n=1 Tax=Alkaliphilus transvaalensis TaxID=114628 RepID=UPI00047B6F3E|nr:hypothetical protein [Alkaliphilus transvaalensis]
MNTLQAIIRLHEIKETIEDKKIKWDYVDSLYKEFEIIKTSLLHSHFAFEKVQNLILEIENKMNHYQ